MRGGELSDRGRKSVVWEDVESAFKGRLKTGTIVNLEHLDIRDFFTNAETQCLREIQRVLRQESAVNVNTTLEGEYSFVKKDEEFIDNMQEPLLRKSSEFQEKDSGWTFRSIISLTVNINKSDPMQGRSYIELPASIQKNLACVNVQNSEEDQCFKWAVFSVPHPTERNPSRLSNYQQHENELNKKKNRFSSDAKVCTKIRTSK